MIVRGSVSMPMALLAAIAALAAGCNTQSALERDALDRWRQVDMGAYRTALETRAQGADAATQTSLPQEPTLDDYLTYAAAHNPGLQAAFQEWKAALERVPQARALMDPQLSYSYYVRESMTQQSASLSQTFPWYDKLRARGDAAMERALAAERRFDGQLQQVRTDVKQAYAEYAYLARALAVVQENGRILRDLKGGAQARFEAGDAPYADLISADVAVEQAQDEIRSLEARQLPLVGRLNATLGRSAHQPLAWPQSLPAAEVAADESQLLAELAKLNPELQALQHESASRRHAHRLARQNRIPDLMLGVEYMEMVPRDMDNQVALMASINLPIWGGRLDAERAEALAEFGAATRRQVNRQNELESELRLSWYQFHDANRRASLFEQTLIPLAKEALDATEAAYSAGEIEFQAVTQAQSALQGTQLIYERVVTDRFQALAELERLVGRTLGGDQPGRPDDVRDVQDQTQLDQTSGRA